MAFNEGSYRFAGRWGAAFDSAGTMISELVQVEAPIEIGRIGVPLVGTMDEGHKQGANTREGTLRVQKIDAAWELKVWATLSQSVEERRAARDRGERFDPSFTLVLKHDDPEALGVERWQLDGVRIWRLPLGINIADELVEREYPITWDGERPLDAFRRKAGAGEAQAEYVYRSR